MTREKSSRESVSMRMPMPFWAVSGSSSAAGRAEPDERVAVDEVTEPVVAVLAPIQSEAERIGHVVGVPDDLALDLEAEVAEGHFAVEMGTG